MSDKEFIDIIMPPPAVQLEATEVLLLCMEAMVAELPDLFRPMAVLSSISILCRTVGYVMQ